MLCLLSKPLRLLLFVLTNTKPQRTSKALDQSACWKQGAERARWIVRACRVLTGNSGVAAAQAGKVVQTWEMSAEESTGDHGSSSVGIKVLSG